MIEGKTRLISIAITTAIFMLVCNGFALQGPDRCSLGSYKGRIVSRDSGKPIEGVVVHATYGACSVKATPGAAAAKLATNVAVRETLTDANGEFTIPADYVSHECPSGWLSGQLQIFKPGYGTIGDLETRRFCTDNNKKEYFCDIEFDKYTIYELPKHETTPWREATLRRISLAQNVPSDQQKLLPNALEEERTFLAQDKDKVITPYVSRKSDLQATSPLLIAAKNNHADKAILLLKDGANVNQKDELGFTPLMYAARFNNVSLVRVLIDKGAELNIASQTGRTPLIEAVINGRKEAVDMMISSGADLKPFSYSRKERINADGRAAVELFGEKQEVRIPVGGPSLSLSNKGQSEIREWESLTVDPLSAAIKSGQNEMAEYLLEKYLDKVNHQQQLDASLHIALSQHNITKQFAALLLDKGATVNSRNTINSTPLFSAVSRGNLEIIDLLLARGAEVNAVNSRGESPLLAAIDKINREVVSLLLKHGATVAPLPYTEQTTTTPTTTPQIQKVTVDPIDRAIVMDQEDIGLLLLDNSAKVAQEQLDAVFLKSLGKRQFRLVDGLIARGANVNMEESPGVPLLNSCIGRSYKMHRLWGKNKDTIHFLCRKGADVNSIDRQGYFPLHYAAQNGDVDVAQILIEHGADINRRSERSGTAIAIAASFYMPEMVRFLLEEGADPNISNPLLSKIATDPGIVKLLLEHRTDPHAVDSWNRTPLFYAIDSNGNIESIQLLLAKGLDPNHLGKDPISYSREETTPLKIALQKENLDAAQLLLDHGADIKASCLKGLVVGAMAEAVKVTADYEESKARAERGRKEAETGIIRKNEAEQIVQFVGKAKANAEEKEKVVSFLIESGADLNVAGDASDKSKGGSPLMYAAQVGRIDYLQLLLDHGAEIDFQNANGDTALIKAADGDKLESIRFLLANGANINLPNSSGDTALIKAVEANKLEVAAFLLAKGADAEVENTKGFTPYWLAKRNDNQEMADLLVKHGAETLSYNAHVVKFSALKAIGLVPSNASPADISPKQLELYQTLIDARRMKD